MARPRIGIWLIGAKGGVAATALVGLTALKKGWMQPVGLVSALPQFAGCDLLDWQDFIVGGHEIRDVRLFDEAWRMHSESRAIDADLLRKCKPELDKIDRQIRGGTLCNVGPTIQRLAGDQHPHRSETPRAAIERIGHDLGSFVTDQRLDHLIVVNVASTEPALEHPESLPADWPSLAKLLDKPQKCPLPASSLYAIAALESGYSYVNFTPSLGASPAAIGQLALERNTRYMGNDGKTGETLLKSTLAPMFAHRNLQIMSWVGHNIFGNMDGKVLDDPVNKQSKVASKDRILRDILGYSPQTLVGIEYIASLGDWKTAWDHIHFQGFLGTPMTFQFIWQGCDSLLAAPLVLDLIRFTERAWRAGQTGPLTFLSSFFKSPLACTENDFSRQFQTLEAWAAALTKAPRTPAGGKPARRSAARPSD
ncbi:MAG TPA: inositol-3-phosphate synthase [Pirellulales bacterium]|jgi:myo-inositol-1-phosphate synthase|nr:inositol-3-phosphate synthase [Pirellulales bacterium]